MKTAVFVLFALLFAPPLAKAELDVAPIEKVAAAYDGVQPGLQSYQAGIETDRIAEILRQMTASIPADLPRPTPPNLTLTWSRAAGTTVTPSQPQTLPVVQEMIRHFSARFAINLPALFLPLHAADHRLRLLKAAETKSSETLLAATRSLIISAAFRDPVDLNGAFYDPSTALPQQGITALTLDLDPDQKVLRRLEIATVTGQHLSVELRHRPCNGGFLLEDVHITSPDGLTDDRIRTTFVEVNSFSLPARQERTTRRAGGEERLTVNFVGHRVNPPPTTLPGGQTLPR